VRGLPGRARARYNLALALREAGREEDALVELAAAERLDPRDPQIVHARAELHAGRGEWDEVRAAAARLAELAPGAPVVADLLRRADAAGR
jgi:Flp pilus assembly protein TadD